MMSAFAGFAAACLLWMFRHFVQQAFWESGEGWKESMKGKTSEQARR